MNLRRVWVQCIKELVQFRRDRLTVALAFGLPVGMLFIFGFAIRLQIQNIPVGVQDFDRSAFSRDYIARIAATQELVAISEPLDASPASLLDTGNVRATIVIPPGAQRDLSAGRSAPIQGLVDATDVVNAETIKQILTATSAFVGAAYAPAAVNSTVALQERVWFNPGGNEALFIVPGVYAVILAIYPTLLAAIAMVRDKERGTIVQAYASRLRASELIAGKCLALGTVGLAEALAIMAIGSAVWGLHFAGDPLPILIGTPLMVCCQVLLGLLIGAGTNTVTSAIQAAGSMNSLISFLLSGFLYPVATMPLVFQWLSYIVPARHYINISRDAFVRGAGWPGVGSEILALALIASILAVGAWMRMRPMQLAG
ncbi:MAG: ABC transporter permease [Vulcanimicrobiaceae bacterium]|jgi:ABC-2 type transport system permease protein